MPAAKRHADDDAADNSSEFARYTGNPDFVLSLARGLRVIESFEGHHDGRSIVEISHSTSLSRAAIRRPPPPAVISGFGRASPPGLPPQDAGPAPRFFLPFLILRS